MSLQFTTTSTVVTGGQDFDIPFTFEYLDERDVKVYKSDTATAPLVLGTAWVFVNRQQIRILNSNQNVVAGDVFVVNRETEVDEAFITYAAGSSIRARDLNNNQQQVLFSAQEREERSLLSTGGTLSGDLNMDDNKVINLGTPTANTDAATKVYVDDIRNANDASLAASVAAAQTAQTGAETAETNAETAETNAGTSETNAATSATNAANSATAAAASATSAAASAGAAANFAADPVFIGITRNVSGGRTVLRVDYSEATNTTNTYNPRNYNYKNTSTSMLTTNGILHTQSSGGTVGEPKIAFATATDASRTSGHVYIQLHN
tara:strand:- start:2262 stop:3227 length:966 start_codon:yes stop_codon:yes gene_type:complete